MWWAIVVVAGLAVVWAFLPRRRRAPEAVGQWTVRHDRGVDIQIKHDLQEVRCRLPDGLAHLDVRARKGDLLRPLGDLGFDSLIELDGRVGPGLHLLDGTARQGLRRLVEAGGRVERGILIMPVKEQRLEYTIRVASDIVGEISGRDIPFSEQETDARLARMVVSEPLPIRLRALERLLSHHQGSLRTTQALIEAMEDPYPEVRAAAAPHVDYSRAEAALHDLLEDLDVGADGRGKALVRIMQQLNEEESVRLFVKVVRDKLISPLPVQAIPPPEQLARHATGEELTHLTGWDGCDSVAAVGDAARDLQKYKQRQRLRT